MSTSIRGTEAFGLHVPRRYAQRNECVRHGLDERRRPAYEAEQIVRGRARQLGQQVVVDPTPGSRPRGGRFPRQRDVDVSIVAP
jgi:hypothetical protein